MDFSSILALALFALAWASPAARFEARVGFLVTTLGLAAATGAGFTTVERAAFGAGAGAGLATLGWATTGAL